MNLRPQLVSDTVQTTASISGTHHPANSFVTSLGSNSACLKCVHVEQHEKLNMGLLQLRRGFLQL